MMADFTSISWSRYVAPLSEPERRQAMRDLSSGVHRVADEAGRVLSFDAGPTHCTTAPPPPFAVRDRSGNVVQEAALAPEPKAPPIRKGFTLENRQSFEEEIQHEPEATRASLRLQYDALRKQHGID